MSKYRWVRHEGEKLYDVGICADGTLHNPRGYPDEVVRTARHGRRCAQRERRSDAAKQAAQTRQYRIRVRVHRIAKRIVAGQAVGPSGRCVVCGKQLADRESIDRGIGSECLQGVLAAITRARAAKANPMVNSGAIATTRIVAGASAEDRWSRVRDGLSCASTIEVGARRRQACGTPCPFRGERLENAEGAALEGNRAGREIGQPEPCPFSPDLAIGGLPVRE